MSQTAKEANGQEYYQNVINRWKTGFTRGIQYEEHFLKLQKEYRKYYANVYVLNSQALKIQHAYFGLMSGTRKTTTIHNKTPKDTSKILFKAKYGLNDASRVTSSKRKLKPPMSKKSILFDDKENKEIEKSINVSPIHYNEGSSRVNSQISENRNNYGNDLKDVPRYSSLSSYQMVSPRNKDNITSRSKNLGTSLRNITNVIHKAVGKYNDTKLTRTSSERKNNFQPGPE